MFFLICPYCNASNSLDQGAPLGTLPPTGGDYEWQESDTKHTCVNCQEKFEIRVRTSLESGELLSLLSSPKPLISSITWYAIATVQENTYGFGIGTFDVRVFQLAQTETEIQDLYAKKYNQKSYQSQHILRVTQDGYSFLNGQHIPELSYYQAKIDYAEY